MRLTRLYLRNYRVYEDPLELELPPGLIGIYGANGAGKSALLESILFSLWGKARTAKEDIRTAGVGGDCVAEVEFEHEGHLYVVRRTLSGLNLTQKAEAHCDGLAMAEGVRDTGRYLHQVLGMDDTAFRASVFAEQKQLAAFSNQAPAERRRLVLQLLGITPLDGAREAARKDARETQQHHDRLRSMLPDLDQLRVQADDARSSAEAAAVDADNDEAARATAQARAARAEDAFGGLDRIRQAHDGLVIEGKAARGLLDEAVASLELLEAERIELATAAATLERVEPKAVALASTEARLARVGAVIAAEQACAEVTVPPEPPPPDQGAADDARRRLDAARAAVAALAGEVGAVAAERARADDQLSRSAQLSGEADCPLCGQALGDAFEQVREHRSAELTAAQARLAALEESRAPLELAATEAETQWKALTKEVAECLRARQAWEQTTARRTEAETALAAARLALAEDDAPAIPTEALLAVHESLRRDALAQREAAALAERLRGRLERRQAVDSQLERTRERVADAEHQVTTLLDKVKSLAFDKAALDAAKIARSEAAAGSAAAAKISQESRLRLERARGQAESCALRLADAQVQHAQLATLAADARHLGRLAELLTAFRNTVVASVGPRLAVQAAELFGELTDREYDRLDVDPDTYELQICDGGRVYGLDRFSGSEIDLANLALRVAISEHVRFQSGGAVGLLVLDEVFGPLDEDRKARMLLALERLGGRFRQILVVTHDVDIKEELPNAVEVHKLAGRRATARLLYA